jgi:hypothetical protein
VLTLTLLLRRRRGIYLTDLTFIEDGNPDYISSLINFKKRELVYDVIREIEQYQQKGYDFPADNSIFNVLNNLQVITVHIPPPPTRVSLLCAQLRGAGRGEAVGAVPAEGTQKHRARFRPALNTARNQQQNLYVLLFVMIMRHLQLTANK